MESNREEPERKQALEIIARHANYATGLKEDEVLAGWKDLNPTWTHQGTEDIKEVYAIFEIKTPSGKTYHSLPMQLNDYAHVVNPDGIFYVTHEEVKEIIEEEVQEEMFKEGMS